MISSPTVTYGVVSEGVFAESLRKFCGKFAETTFHCARKGCGNSAESLRKFRGNLRKLFCNDPFPNDPISELLMAGISQYFSYEGMRVSDRFWWRHETSLDHPVDADRGHLPTFCGACRDSDVTAHEEGFNRDGRRSTPFKRPRTDQLNLTLEAYYELKSGGWKIQTWRPCCHHVFHQFRSSVMLSLAHQLPMLGSESWGWACQCAHFVRFLFLLHGPRQHRLRTLLLQVMRWSMCRTLRKYFLSAWLFWLVHGNSSFNVFFYRALQLQMCAGCTCTFINKRKHINTPRPSFGKPFASVENPRNWHFFPGGPGETQFCGQNDFMDIPWKP